MKPTASEILRQSIQHEDFNKYKDLFSSGELVHIANYRDEDERNFLHWIAERGLDSFLLEALRVIGRQLDLDAVDEDGWTALHVGAANDRDSVVRLLIRAGADMKRVTVGGSNSALHIAAGKGLTRICSTILEEAAHLNLVQTIIDSVNKEKVTPLQRAVAADRVRTAEVLIKGGADMNVRWRDTGESLLHVATGNLSAEMIRLLLNHKPTLIKCEDKRGLRPYHCENLKVLDLYREEYLDLIDDEK